MRLPLNFLIWLVEMIAKGLEQNRRASDRDVERYADEIVRLQAKQARAEWDSERAERIANRLRVTIS